MCMHMSGNDRCQQADKGLIHLKTKAMTAVAARVVIEDLLIDHFTQGKTGHTTCCAACYAAKHCVDDAA